MKIRYSGFLCILLIIIVAMQCKDSFSQVSLESGMRVATYPCEDDLIEIMFIQSSQVRLRNDNLIDMVSDATQGLEQVISQFGWHKWNRITEVEEAMVDSWSVNGSRNTGKEIYNLNNIYRLQIPKGHDIWNVCVQLEMLPGVLSARPVPKPMALPSPTLPANYQPQQGYLKSPGSNPSGIDALWSWTQSGGDGTNIKVCDLEYSWNYNHADVTKAFNSQINSNISDPFNNDNHGTAVIGQLVSDNNGWGTTGICYGANLLTCGTYYGWPTPYWNVPGAIAVAMAYLGQGDVIMLEQQWDYTGNSDFVPIECWTDYYPNPQTQNAVYVAIVNAVANGISVVEAGGNGNYDTDQNLQMSNLDSGAIIVGAGTASPTSNLKRIAPPYQSWGSSFGSRFNMQGWGENVVTTGYGDLYNAQGPNYYYTSVFAGTSSSSPIVAGALVCVQGYYKANFGSVLSPLNARTALVNAGTPQVFPPFGYIGPRPDIQATIPSTVYDFGDAPDPPYPTLISSSGASHVIDGVTFLGFGVDPEPNGQPDPFALGDDNDGNNDDDGVTFSSALIPGQIALIQVRASATGFLNAWIDFNHTNVWGDPGEFIFQNHTLSPGLNNLSFPVPMNAMNGYTFARFRFSTVGGLLFYDAFGPAPNGEVEDYMVYIGIPTQDLYDYGDAPDGPYPTLLASNGARHLIGALHLGANVDAELDGQPDATATGDDLNGNDDEDGVIIQGPIIPGQNIIIQFNISGATTGFLNGWFDWNGNGSWAELGEHAIVDFLASGGVLIVNVPVPPNAALGTTFARFRISTVQGLSIFGMAPDGEVEDYSIQVGVADIPIDPDPTQNFAQNEISLALVPGSPGNPAILLAAYNDHPIPGGPGLGVSISTDGGTTWVPQQLAYPLDPSGNAYLDMFDPTATADGNGDLYVGHIATDANWIIGPESALFVHKSTDGGNSWVQSLVSYDPKPQSNPDPNYRFNDRCQIIADVNPASPYYNNLYIVWIKDRGWNMPQPWSDIYFSRSVDGGLTWSQPAILNQPINNMGNMPVPEVASDGSVYVCWVDYNVITGGFGQIYINKSSDGGLTWLPQEIPVGNPVLLPPLRLNQGSDVLAKGAAIVRTCPTNPMEVYIAYAQQAGSGDEADIIFLKSTDGGNTWPNSLRINDDITFNDQVLPWMQIKPNGMIDIVWYDRRNDPADLLWEVFMATSTDGGISFLPNQKVNQGAWISPVTNIQGKWMGEYLGLAADHSTAYIAYTSSIPDIQGDIYFCKALNPASMDKDFGDAPDGPYQTLLANNGARHSLDGITILGSFIDAETDGQPSPLADGDDLNNLADEDGVFFATPLVPGSLAIVHVIALNTCLLNAWIDFNKSNAWADPGEHIFINQPLVPGLNVLNYNVPVTALPGATYARFRVNQNGGISYFGDVFGGEVEDYMVSIEEPPIEEYDFGDAPEGAIAYPATGVIGMFPTCINVGPPGNFIRHKNSGAIIGLGVDLETDGNAGTCPAFNPNKYDQDECCLDGDAGLWKPGAFTITGPIGAEVVVPCLNSSALPLGNVCSPAAWGANIDFHVQNYLPSGAPAFVNVLIDWNQDGQWVGSSVCPSGLVIFEHVLVNFPIPNGFAGPIGVLMPPPFLTGPNAGYVWARISITDVPVGPGWYGAGIFEAGETEDYLLHVIPVNDLNLLNISIPGGQTVCFDAANTITTAGAGTTFIVQNGAVVYLVAGHNIIMKDGTYFQSGSYVHAYIDQTGEFCSNPKAIVVEEESLPETSPPELNRKESFFKVYPNPTTGGFTMEFNDDPGDNNIVVEIYNLIGERVMFGELPGEKLHHINITQVKPGIYIVRAIYSKKTGIVKLIKQ